eukprot:NODE_935_length_650_cov_404.600666_g864_i0.p1 GENE.NODE_935_length_650_cov_404.600666_g864_i0~~NODE_935_length_650_cov_404.600666_g864_i0.p1  ORF type:complete len:125 (-),score=28.01 NODE_935_length_650_cov_404.600666_g864_i0:168-542(-)
MLGLFLFIYLCYEYLFKSFTKSKWSGRNYCPHEIKKHDSKLDSNRPVRCEITGKVMTAKEYVYRWRFIAGTQAGEVYEPPPPPAPIGVVVPPPMLPGPPIGPDMYGAPDMYPSPGQYAPPPVVV